MVPAWILLSLSFLGVQETIEIRDKREIFVDSHLIDRADGVRLVLAKPKDEGPVLSFDEPWEGPFSGYTTVIADGDTLRLYYRGLPMAGGDGKEVEVTCYAESPDGVHWTKPDLELFEVMGTKKNNVILAQAAPATHNFSPFLDSNPKALPGERFKALGGIQTSGLIAFRSEDGIHWTRLDEKPVFQDGVFDSQNVSFWSESEQAYLCYFRSWSKGVRTVSRTTSKDFRTWTPPVSMKFGDTEPQHLYTNQTHPYFRAPHIYVSVAARFFPGRQVVPDSKANSLGVNSKYYRDCSDAVLLTSRGGSRFDRTFMEGFIRPGIGLANWVSRTNYPALNVVPTGQGEMSLYVNQDYAQPSAHLRRYAMRLDGFASIHADWEGGELITHPLHFSEASLTLNFSTSAGGRIRVALLDDDERPFEGYSLSDCDEIIGNEIDRVVTWKGRSEISPDHRRARLRVQLKDADLFSLQFVPLGAR